MLLLVCGQVIRPSYHWLLAQRQAKMLAEARNAIDPDGFARLEALRPASLIRTDALNRITWIALHKGGRVKEWEPKSGSAGGQPSHRKTCSASPSSPTSGTGSTPTLSAPATRPAWAVSSPTASS